MAAKSNKEVAKKEEAGLPVDADLLAGLQAAGEKREAMGKDDMSIPFIQILQALSPQCTKGEPEYIKGAEPSMLFNTVTQEMFPTLDDDDNPVTGLHVVSIAYKASFIEWVPRAQGGGFVAEYDVATGSTAVTQRNDQNLDIIQPGSPVGTPGNQLSYTHTHFVFVVNKETGRVKPAVISATSTQVKPSKNWNALVNETELPNGAAAPRFFGVWAVKTQRRSNDHGTWYVWKFERDGTILDFGNEAATSIMKAAQEFAKGVEAGETNADYSKGGQDTATGDNPDVGEGGKGGETDEEIPF